MLVPGAVERVAVDSFWFWSSQVFAVLPRVLSVGGGQSVVHRLPIPLPHLFPQYGKHPHPRM